MTQSPEETRKERSRRRMLGLGVVLVFVLLSIIVVQGVIQYRSQTNHHAASVKQQQTIIALLHTVHAVQTTNTGTVNAVAALEKEVATVIEGLPAADTELVNEANALAQEVMAVCQSTHANCPPLPAIPSS